MIWRAILALGGGISALALLILYVKGEEEGEPAAPVALPPPALSGGSGIDTSPTEVEALARVIASEAGSGTNAEQKSIAWTVRNRFRNKSIYNVEHPWRSQLGSKPPFSSSQDAHDVHRELAAAILAADQGDDPTGGATAFFEPKMQDIFFKAGELARSGEIGDRVIDGVRIKDITRFKNYKLDANGVRSKWMPGDTIYAKAGRFEFWGNSKLFAKRGNTIKTVVAGILHDNDDAQEAIARVVESSGGKTCEEQQAIAWVVRNRAARNGVSIFDASRELPDDSIPSEWSMAIAKAVITQPAENDPTGGAVDFWRPETQRHGRALGDLYHALASQDEMIQAAEFDYWKNFATEEEVRALHVQQGLTIRGIIGTLELLG